MPRDVLYNFLLKVHRQWYPYSCEQFIGGIRGRFGGWAPLLSENFTKLDMCFWNTDATGGNKVKIRLNFKVLHFDPTPHPGTCDVSEGEQPLYEFTVKFGNCIIKQNLNIALCLKTGRNYGQMDKLADGRTIRFLDVFGRPRAGGIKRSLLVILGTVTCIIPLSRSIGGKNSHERLQPPFKCF